MNLWQYIQYMLNRNKIFLAVLAVLMVTGLVMWNNKASEIKQIEEGMIAELQEGEILVRGEIACLPFKEENAGGDCVKGIKGEDDRLYALDSLKVRRAEANMEVGTEVLATGLFEPANPQIGESAAFLYDGVLVLSGLEVR